MPFVCVPQTSAGGEGSVPLQITDLFPNRSQFNPTLLPAAQGPNYVYGPARSLTATVQLDGNFVVQAEVEGLAAYIISTVEKTSAAAIALTPAEADAIAAEIISRMEAGQSLSVSDVNTLIQAETADLGDLDGIGKGNSTASLTEILQILGGYKVFTLPAAHDVGNENAGDAFLPMLPNDQAAKFSTPYGASRLFNFFESSFYISARSGQIKKAQEATPPLLVVYADDGSVIK